MYRVNVSSVQSFAQCRFRWWCEYVMNRVPVATAPALDAGRLLHTIFEDHFNGKDIVLAAQDRVRDFRRVLAVGPVAARPSAEKAAIVIEDLIEALPLWKDKFEFDEVLEVEQPFEWEDPEMDDVIWIGRPDRNVRKGKRIWHNQNRGLAASMNFGMYCRLAKRHYHEHLYAEAGQYKYASRGLIWGGTVFNLLRKLKFRTNVGKKNEAVKTANEMFYQQAVAYNLKSPLHAAVMMAMRQQVREMLRVIQRWEDHGEIPAPNEKMNGGFSGSMEDPYFKVLIGETKLSDNKVFKDRENPYAEASQE